MIRTLRVRRISLPGLAIALILFITSSTAQPKLTVEKARVDMGSIYNGATKKARIVVKNAGKDTLRILGVTTSCGCTTAKRPKEFLRPGEKDVVEIEFNSTGFRGEIVKHVSIVTNDPLTPTTEVTLVGTVIEELQPVGSSSVIWLGAVPVGKQVTQTVKFKNVSGKVLTITGCKGETPDIVVVFGQRTVMPADTILFSVKVTPRKADYISEQLLLETDSKKQSQVPIRVTLIGVKPE